VSIERADSAIVVIPGTAAMTEAWRVAVGERACPLDGMALRAEPLRQRQAAARLTDLLCLPLCGRER
jgi:hypothetical protein